MSIKPKVPQVVEDISRALVPYFGENLLSVLLYGSGQREEKFWDLDILVILKEKTHSLSDLSFLQTVVTTFTEHDLDLQLFYSNEVDSADSFSLDAHGAFFSKVLADAVVVYGANPFTSFSPSEELVIVSLLNRIQRYIFQVRREYIGIGRHVRDKNPRYHQKHLRRVLLDLMLMLGPCNSVAQAEELFKQRFPGVLPDSQWGLFVSDSDMVADYLEVYEKIYNIALEVSHTLLPRENRRPGRASIQGMVCEYLLPSSYTEAVIVVDGLPRAPELRSFINLLASWGYATFFPRLKGTWESTGNFLDHNPAEDIGNLAHDLKEGVVLEGNTIHVERVFVIGASFGGLVALGASLHKDIAFAVALSPVYAMSEVSHIETLDHFIKEVYGGAYRYSDGDWRELINNDILSLERIGRDASFDGAKCVAVAGETDDQINTAALNVLCERYGIVSHKIAAGHLSLHKDMISLRPLLHNILKENT